MSTARRPAADHTGRRGVQHGRPAVRYWRRPSTRVASATS